MNSSSTFALRPRRIIAVSALLLLGGGLGAIQAESAVETAAADNAATSEQASTPIFTPSVQAQFTDAFSHLPGASTNIAIPDHAVDLATIEPAAQPAAQPTAEPAGRNLGHGVASYYGRRFAGRPTANGETFNPSRMTAAHRTLPFGSRVRVTNERNGRSVIVRINDRGPFIRGREIDLSRGAAERIGMIQAGHARVKLELVES